MLASVKNGILFVLIVFVIAVFYVFSSTSAAKDGKAKDDKGKSFIFGHKQSKKFEIFFTNPNSYIFNKVPKFWTSSPNLNDRNCKKAYKVLG